MDEGWVFCLPASQTQQGPRMEAVVQADFAELEAGGTIESGNINGKVDFSLLRQRLSEWVEVPISNMQGSAEIKARWNMENELTRELNLPFLRTVSFKIDNLCPKINDPDAPCEEYTFGSQYYFFLFFCCSQPMPT